MLESQVASPILPNQLLDLELLHNFTTATSDTLSDRDGVNELFRVAMVAESFKYDFLIRTWYPFLLSILDSHPFHEKIILSCKRHIYKSNN